MQLLIARNPDPESSLPFLLLVPLGDGLLFRSKGTWPRTSALYCHPAPRSDWPTDPDLVEQIPLRSCTRRGAAIDVVADRSRESRSRRPPRPLAPRSSPWAGQRQRAWRLFIAAVIPRPQGSGGAW